MASTEQVTKKYATYLEHKVKEWERNLFFSNLFSEILILYADIIDVYYQ